MTAKFASIAAALAATAIALYLALTQTGSERMADSAPPQTAPPDGARVYAQYCAECHGADLSGQADWRNRAQDGKLPAPPHDETGHTWHHPDQMLFEMTKYGPRAFAGPDYPTDMPGYDGVLTDDEIVAVLDYIKRQWPESIRERQRQITESYRSD